MPKFKKSLEKVKANYKGLAKAVGGFTKKESDLILGICVKNTLLNCGQTNQEIEMMKLFPYTYKNN